MSGIADKISKLIAKAESTTHKEEAEAFMAKVHQLLEAHGMSLLEVGKLQSDDPVGTTRDAGIFYASESSFSSLAFRLASYYGCEAIITYIGNHRHIHIIGRESARVTFGLMWPYIKKSIRANARRLQKEEGSTVARHQRWISDALTNRVEHLLYERILKERKEKTVTTGVNALVPVDLLQLEREKEFPRTSSARKRKLEATDSACEAAAGIGLDVQMGGGTVKKIGR